MALYQLSYRPTYDVELWYDAMPPERLELSTPWFVARYSDPLSYGGNGTTS